jgi:hypothetical protein
MHILEEILNNIYKEDPTCKQNTPDTDLCSIETSLALPTTALSDLLKFRFNCMLLLFLQIRWHAVEAICGFITSGCMAYNLSG